MAVSALAAAPAHTTSLSLAGEIPADVASSFSSLSSSPRQFPTDLSSPILEEGDESESEPTNEPVTPVSGRQSQDFQRTPPGQDVDSDLAPESLFASEQPVTAFASSRAYFTSTPSKYPLVLNTGATAPALARPAHSPTRQAQHQTPPEQQQEQESQTSPQKTQPAQSTPSANGVNGDSDPALVPLTRRSTRGSTSSFRLGRTMSSFFRKGNANGGGSDKAVFNLEASSDSNLDGFGQRRPPPRRFSMNRSSVTTRSNTPPSPSSPLEMVFKSEEQASTPTVPDAAQFLKKKTRASTGLHFGRVGFLGSNSASNSARHAPAPQRRASSFDASKQDRPLTGRANESHKHNPRHVWALAPEEGTGVKARRMSLSLPDDFTVDIGDLLAEFEYQHKILGRHGKHLGKGATSKVTLMVRKGNSGELYAVKEFRGRMSSDTVEEYEKKIKSEYTVAKSLHHPNIIETFRLCKDHGRWNHVMEFCQEGDLFSIVKKGYLKGDDHQKDRFCLFKQLLQAVDYLHSHGIAHRDLKCENLLLTSESRLKITDFGVSEVFCGIHPGLREAGGQCGQNMGKIRLSSPGICGSMPYIAPEVITKDGPYDPRGLDVWSAAVCMLYLTFGGCLWDEAKLDGNSGGRRQPTYEALVKGWERCNAKNSTLDISEKDYPRVPAFEALCKPPALKRVLLQMLNPDPSKRLTITEVMNNRWIKNIECCVPESYDDPTHVIDASKMSSMARANQKKVFCHNHLEPRNQYTSHSLGRMPGQAGY